jgi:hypothetical protein
MVSRVRSRAGTSRLGCVIQLAILAGIIYFGIYAGQDLLDYYRLRDAMKQEGRFATIRTDAQIRDRLRLFADSVGLPAEAQEINIVRDENTIRIWTELRSTSATSVRHPEIGTPPPVDPGSHLTSLRRNLAVKFRDVRAPSDKIASSRDDAVARRGTLRGTVVFTNGVFDLLHPGHVDLLTRRARRGCIDCRNQYRRICETAEGTNAPDSK